MIKEINVSNGFENYSQRNNKISPSTSCGPTNMIQAAEYAGYNVYSIDMFPSKIQKILHINPMTTIIESYRNIFYYL